MLNFAPVNRPSLFAASPALLSVAAPVLALILTTLGGILLFALLGKDPVAGLSVFFWEPIRSVRGWTEIGVKCTPLILCAIGYAICYRSSVMTIGAEGMLVAGAIAAGGTALALDHGAGSGGAFAIALVMAAGILGGMVWAGITALLKDRFNTDEILVSLMLVYVAQLLLSYLVTGPWKDPMGFNFPQSKMFSPGLLLPQLVKTTRLNLGFVFALVAVVVAWVFMTRSFAGYRLRVGGMAPLAARYAGFSRRGALWMTLLIAGATSGLAGAIETIGPVGQLLPSMSPGYGFAAIIVAYVGRLHPVGILFGSFIMALFYIGGELAQSRLGLPNAITGVFQGMLLFFLLAADALMGNRAARGH
ncbi:nucleoside ABC transporter membrane protein [Noviherbaspirillum humi]|uniref:Nucleoside ABC transporter membrane protein n=1 Tax=Noviherbaspirillum humi TaxID=1688639 RepID=A0A239HUQ8_9BURK|nr:ABC transporter permease [Noviherbaspirillum humi]SNS85011.1 nucleoside ABC transporter membrane protein [Noviherbaspirillum humi]